MNKPDRFKLEQAIYDADMSAELKMAFERHCDGPVMTQDQRDNMLMALWQIAELKQWKLFDTFCRIYELDQYCKNQEVLSAREEMVAKLNKELWMEDSEGNKYPMPKGSLKEDVE